MTIENPAPSKAEQEAAGQSLSGMLRAAAGLYADRTAILWGGTRWSYARFDDIVDDLGRGLKAAGVVPGARVAAIARNNHGFVALRFALARIGAVFVPVNFMLMEQDARYILDHSGATMLFLDAASLDVGLRAADGLISAIYALPGEDGNVPVRDDMASWQSLLLEGDRLDDMARGADLLQIIYTSGTESRPKGAMLTHQAVLAEYQSCIDGCEWDAETIALHALPLFHCAQLDAMLGPALQAGATNIITADPAASNVIPLIERHGATSFFAPPTIWIGMLRSPLFDLHDMSTLKRAYYGASIMPVEVAQELQRRLPGLRLWNLYGQTEIAPVATILRPEDHASHPGSAGRPVLNVQTRVVDDDMNDVPPGATGEVVHRSPQLFTGYWNDPDRTAQAFLGGWFHSGDLATIDADGYITIVDRKKDMINSGGENVSSREVEEALYTHPAVAEAAVIGLPDARWIEAVTAIVVRRPGTTCSEQEILDHVAARLSGFKRPKTVRFVDALPKTASGKILKRDLRDRVLAQHETAGPLSPEDGMGTE